MNALDLLPPEIWEIIYSFIIKTHSSRISRWSRDFMATCSLFRAVATKYVASKLDWPEIEEMLIKRQLRPDKVFLQNIWLRPIDKTTSAPYLFFLHQDQIKFLLSSFTGLHPKLFHEYVESTVPYYYLPIQKKKFALGCRNPLCRWMPEHLEILREITIDDFLSWGPAFLLPEYARRMEGILMTCNLIIRLSTDEDRRMPPSRYTREAFRILFQDTPYSVSEWRNIVQYGDLNRILNEAPEALRSSIWAMDGKDYSKFVMWFLTNPFSLDVCDAFLELLALGFDKTQGRGGFQACLWELNEEIEDVQLERLYRIPEIKKMMDAEVNNDGKSLWSCFSREARGYVEKKRSLF